MLSVSRDIIRYTLSNYLSDTDILALSETCTQLLSCYPLEYRTKLVFHARLEHLSKNYGRKWYDMNGKTLIGINRYPGDEKWWNACIKHIQTENNRLELVFSTFYFTSHFALHILSYAVYQHVYIICIDVEDARATVLDHFNRNVSYYWPLMITSARYDPSRITFSSLTSGKEYIVHFCTGKRLKKRRKLGDDVLILYSD